VSELHDRPLTRPEDDLLDMNRYAERLARQLPLQSMPLTLGIYGGWGEGKTTFARLLAHYLPLQPGWSDARFVDFSAWPYVTADVIWRAMLEHVARTIYEVPDEPPVAPPETTTARIRRQLLKEVFAEPDVTTGTFHQEAFDQMMTRLGRLTGIASRASGDAAAVQQVSLLAGVVADLLSVFTGPMGSLRRVVGLGSESFGTAGVPSRAQAPVTSVEEMRASIRHLFAAARGRKTIILLDDLDRCMPEVALDVLETIKIFFSEGTASGAECLFIIAADEEILSRGLRQRLGSAENEPVREAEARAYLEKMVQLGVAVAKVRSASPERLISTAFPEWIGGMDLLAAGAGGNPRRLKQQCYLLSYGYDVSDRGSRA
jgi:hypothetical protein